MVDSVVFLGPSLSRDIAQDILPGARIAPPVKRGDIDALLAGNRRPGLIGVVDGEFLQSLAISPKEVLRAIDGGVRVFGAASMGALRAVELAPYGMVGVGRIYELFLSGAIDADDEVAVAFDPETLRPLCDALVNIRIAIAGAVDEGVIPAGVGDRFVALAKKLYFPQRRYGALLSILRGELADGPYGRLAAYLGERAPDAKRDDAVEMLWRMRAEMRASDARAG